MSLAVRRWALFVVASLVPLTIATPVAGAADAPDPVPAGVDAFALHSNPGATKTLYLDFTGHHLEGTGYNATGHGYSLPPTDAPPFDFDDDPSFSSLERDYIYNTWQVVSEDFAPLEVDVTTEEPSWDAIERDSTEDAQFGAWLIVTPDTAGDSIKQATCGTLTCAGFSEIGYVDSTDNVFRHSFRFVPKQTQLSPTVLGNVASHELGHALGLSHDTRAEYEDWLGWGPMMGPDLSHPYTVFSAGEYQGGSNKEDDFAVMSSHGIALRSDDHGDNPDESADPLPRGATVSGILTTRTDKDVFRVEHSCDGPLTLSEHGAQPAGNLDAQLRLLDADGNELGRDDPPMDFAPDDFHANLGLDASISMSRPAGTYYVEVDGIGVQTGSDGTLPTDYGSVGRYTLTHTSDCTGVAPGPPPALPAPPAPPVTVAGAPRIGTASSGAAGGRSTATVRWRAPVTTGGSPVTAYRITALRLRPSGAVLGRRVFTVAASKRSLVMPLPKGRYRFVVVAASAAGASPASARSNVVRAR